MALLLASLPFVFLKLGSVRAIGIVAGLLAIYYAVVTGIEKWRVHKSRSWPTAPGTISDVAIQAVDGGVNGAYYTRVNFVYTYEFQGKPYTGKYHVNCVTDSIQKAAFAGISAGQAIVHINPAEPAKGLLWEDEVWNLW